MEAGLGGALIPAQDSVPDREDLAALLGFQLATAVDTRDRRLAQSRSGSARSEW